MPETTDPRWLQLLLSLAVGFLGAGAGAAVFYRALKDRLIEDLVKIFAKKSELPPVKDKVEGLKTMVVTALDHSDDALGRMELLEERISSQNQRFDEVLREPLRQLASKVDRIHDQLTDLQRSMNGRRDAT